MFRNKKEKRWFGMMVAIVWFLAVVGTTAGGWTTARVSISSAGVQGNSHSDKPSISSDGRYVAFRSSANNLVAGDTNASTDVFVHDQVSGTTARVSISSAGVQGNSHSDEPSISSDGRYVAFHSTANDLVSGDTNGSTDVFVHDRVTGTTARVSINSAGVQGNSHSNKPSISSDGRYVAFRSTANNLVSGDTNGSTDVFVHERGLLTLVAPNGGEELVAGSTYEITWETIGTVESVFIEYSRNTGSDWTAVDTVTNTGSYEWLVPQENSQQCVVRVSDAAYPSANDVSNGVFRIYVCTLGYDLNHDCFVDLFDFSLLASEWLKCGDPCEPNCQP